MLLTLAGCAPVAPGAESSTALTSATPSLAPTTAIETPTVASTSTLTVTTGLTPTFTADDPLANTSWQLVGLGAAGDEEPPSGAVIPTLEFGAGGTVGGSGGCNRFGGTYRLADNTLSFSQFTSTRMACPADVMTQEGRYLTALAAVTQFEAGRELLRLVSASGGEELNFVQTAPAAAPPPTATPTGTVTATGIMTTTPSLTITVTTTATGSGEVGDCTWTAIHNLQPPGPAALRVSGVCIMPTPGYTLSLTRAEPQGINPAILLLNLAVTAPTGMVAQVLTSVEVVYTEETEQLFDQVTILAEGDLPTGGTVDVEEVR